MRITGACSCRVGYSVVACSTRGPRSRGGFRASRSGGIALLLGGEPRPQRLVGDEHAGLGVQFLGDAPPSLSGLLVGYDPLREALSQLVFGQLG